MDRSLLRDDRWEQIAGLLPNRRGDPETVAKDHRLFVEAVLWIARTGEATVSIHVSMIVIGIDRNLVEQFFNRIKQFRRISTRYNKIGQKFHGHDQFGLCNGLASISKKNAAINLLNVNTHTR